VCLVFSWCRRLFGVFFVVVVVRFLFRFRVGRIRTFLGSRGIGGGLWCLCSGGLGICSRRGSFRVPGLLWVGLW
jgi:hypothetical protein